MLGFGVQTRQARDGVASGASRWRGHAARSVWAMAIEAPRAHLTVGRVGLSRVTAGARNALARPRMGLVTANAGLVPERRAGGFSLVTRFARRADGATMWLVTTHAPLVPSVYFAVGIGVAGGASGTCFRVMGQALMTALASAVAHACCGQRERLLMTTLAHCALCQCGLEVVRGVTASARGTSVKSALGSRLLMAAAARPRQGRLLGQSRVRVMASQATAEPSAFRVVRMNVPMAGFARCSRAFSNVMWLVTTRAPRMRRHLRLCQHHHVRMARATGNRVLASKVVGAVTAHAGRVASCE